MSETLSYDNTPETEVLTEEEQDSLQVGEELVAQQEQLLAGKYKNAEELESAYLSLQKKLGQQEEGEEYEEGEEGYTEEEESDEEVFEDAPAVSLINEASAEYYANEGELSEETINKFSEMSSQDLVNAYMEIQRNNPQAQQSYEMSDAEVNSVKNAAGGEANYDRVVQWAADNLPDQQVNAFDSVVDTGNAAAIGIAFQGLQSAFDEANGYEGRMLQGKAPASSGETFRSQAELVAAMGDPRYENDPAYRADVVAKLEQSDLNF